MMVRVSFDDGDFWNYIHNACESFMQTMTHGLKGNGLESEHNYRVARDFYGIEKIRKAIVLSAYGYKVAFDACRLYNDESYDLPDRERVIAYLDKIIHIEEVEDFAARKNIGDCYINIFANVVYDV